jgi:hypothetical protein
MWTAEQQRAQYWEDLEGSREVARRHYHKDLEHSRERARQAYKLFRERRPERAKELARLAQRRYRERNREKVRAEARAYYVPHPERARTKPYTLRQKARATLNTAVDAGTIVKPDHCTGCGLKPVKHQLHGHHSDYSKPLEVRWLCSVCHGLEGRIKPT